ncbi:MAG: methylenetetrahydrofolate--tRNA-(uracil(54)-C(5))-methyltransferase (FADH(2)-oxidizing) TrmFO, partial [Clostridia bacterium]
MKDEIIIIGGGLAGCEAAYQVAKRGIKVKLYEMKPNKFSPAHSNSDLAEIVCSNSFKSNLHTNACGLLKEELRMLDSLLIKIADKTSVPAGQALAVDREEFAKKVTKELEQMDKVTIVRQEVGKDISLKELAKDSIVIVATGPLTSDSLSEEILEITGENDLHFYDAAAPIISRDSINMDIAFYGNRYDQERPKEADIEDWKVKEKQRQTNLQKQYLNKTNVNNVNQVTDGEEASYINLPMNKEEYEKFWNELVNAEVVELHKFEKREIFEGCMPVEVMAKRGIDTLRYGPLKPMGFTDPRTGVRPYAV